MAIDSVPLTVVTDAKDVYDKGGSDTPSYGAQKSLAFTVAWIRSMLGRTGTDLKWTSTENMFIDAGTKDMDLSHIHRILDQCKWSVKYSPSFVMMYGRAQMNMFIDAGTKDLDLSHIHRILDQCK